MMIILAVLAPLIARAALPAEVVACNDYVANAEKPECLGQGAGCVNTYGWYSKDNVQNPNQRVNAQQICLEEGYKDGASATNYGGNWGHQCRHPGNNYNAFNKAGGSLTSFGYTVSWMCVGKKKGLTAGDDMPTRAPLNTTPSPTGPNRFPFEVLGYKPVVDCGKYATHFRNNVNGKECHNKSGGCVGEGWFSKDNTANPNQRVNAVAICKANGFTGADANQYGGNWGDQCRFPGSGRTPNKAGGALTQLGYTVSWKCTGNRGNPQPQIAPTPEPSWTSAHDEGYPPLPEHVIDCGNYSELDEEDQECVGQGLECVGDHWYSKDSMNHRVNAEQICIDQGYKGVHQENYGGNWGHNCRYPGSMRGTANKAGGDVKNLGYTVTWQCEMPRRAPGETTAKPTMAPTLVPTRTGTLPEIKTPQNVVYCGEGHYADETVKECANKQSPCVGEGWFSKDNTVNPNQRVNAVQICKDNGFEGADPNHYGGNWGHQCRFPGQGNQPNKAGGALTALGYTVSWRCILGGTPPTVMPTINFDNIGVDCGKYEKEGNSRECLPQNSKNEKSVCVGKGWFSKDNTREPGQRVNADAICQANGYDMASPKNFGGNWGHQCRFPGTDGNPNRAGGALTNLGYTVTWQCIKTGGTMVPTGRPTFSRFTRSPTVPAGDLKDTIGKLVTVCGDYNGAECKSQGQGCVGKGWYSKDNTVLPWQRVNAQKICELEGYEGVGEFGGNWGHQCRYPGNAKGTPNKAGGVVTNLGYTVSWQCTGKGGDSGDDDDCKNTEKVTLKTQKKFCKASLQGGEEACKASGCKYKGGKKPKCKAAKKIKCKQLPGDVCCQFKGCELHKKKDDACTGTFEGYED